MAEDDDEVRQLTRRVLQTRGYTVLEASDGQAALHIAAGHTGQIHLLLTDVVMPGMNGRALADQLTPAWPGLKVLYMSGYTHETIARHGVLEPGVAFIQKPFGPHRPGTQSAPGAR